MRIEDFHSGSYRQQFQYRSFQPEAVNHAWTWQDASINSLLSEANRWLGELNAFSGIHLPNRLRGLERRLDIKESMQCVSPTGHPHPPGALIVKSDRVR